MESSKGDFFFFLNTGFLCISSFFVLVWSYLLGTTVHLSVSCSLVQRGRRAQTLGALSWSCWGCFSSALFLFVFFGFLANRSPDMTHVCLSVSVWTASFCTVVILTSQSVWSIVTKKKIPKWMQCYDGAWSLSVHLGTRLAKTCCRWKEECRCSVICVCRVSYHLTCATEIIVNGLSGGWYCVAISSLEMLLPPPPCAVRAW